MKETVLRIRIFPDSLLRKKARSLEAVTEQERQILSQMSRLMYESAGIGLAAPQVGISKAMIVVDINKGLYKLINPKILKKEGYQVREEGCLSLPGTYIKVRRAKKILLEARDENFKPLKFEASDLFACVLQHEIDHLQGRLIIDYVSWLERMILIKKLKKLSLTQTPLVKLAADKENKSAKFF